MRGCIVAFLVKEGPLTDILSGLMSLVIIYDTGNEILLPKYKPFGFTSSMACGSVVNDAKGTFWVSVERRFGFHGLGVRIATMDSPSVNWAQVVITISLPLFCAFCKAISLPNGSRFVKEPSEPCRSRTKYPSCVVPDQEKKEV